MDAERAVQYIKLLEDNLDLMQRRQDFMQEVQKNYGNHKADSYLRNINELDVLIKENNQKLKEIKEG